MIQLFMFLPGRRVESPDELAACGFGGLTDPDQYGIDDRLAFFPDAHGPNAEAGTAVVFSALDAPFPSRPPFIDQAKQVWVSTVSEWDELAAPAWIGYWRDFPPGPETLRRRTQYVGALATLGGDEWLLPIFTRLPLVPTLDSECLDEPEVTPADRLAHRVAREIWVHARPVDFRFERTPAGSQALVEHALTKNYRGNWQSWAALGVLNEDDQAAIGMAMLATTGIQKFIELQDRGE